MTASDKMQARIEGLTIKALAQLWDQTSQQAEGADADTHEALAIVRGFLMDELDKRDPEIVDAYLDSGQDSMAALVKPERIA